MGTITVALAYLNGSVTQINNSEKYQINVKEPRSIKNKQTGKYEIKNYIKYKLFVYRNKIPQSLLDYADFQDRQNNNISISIAFSGEIEKIYTKEDNPKVTEPIITISIHNSDHFVAINKEMMAIDRKLKENMLDDF